MKTLTFLMTLLMTLNAYAVPFMWTGATDNDYGVAGNYTVDGVIATSLPTSADVVIVDWNTAYTTEPGAGVCSAAVTVFIASTNGVGATVDGQAVFLTGYNGGTVNSNAIMSFTAYNAGTIALNAVFDTSAFNGSGATTKNAIFDLALHQGTVKHGIFDNSWNEGAVYSSAIFDANDNYGPPWASAGNAGAIQRNAIFDGYAQNNSMVYRNSIFDRGALNGTYFSYYYVTVYGNAIFSDMSCNWGTVSKDALFIGGIDLSSNIGTISGNAVFRDSLNASGVVANNAIFCGTIGNQGSVTLNGYFHDATANNYGSFQGTVGRDIALYDTAVNGGILGGITIFPVQSSGGGINGSPILGMP